MVETTPEEEATLISQTPEAEIRLDKDAIRTTSRTQAITTPVLRKTSKTSKLPSARTSRLAAASMAPSAHSLTVIKI